MIAFLLGLICGMAVTWLVFARYRTVILRSRNRAMIAAREARAARSVASAQMKYLSAKLQRERRDNDTARATIEAYSRMGK